MTVPFMERFFGLATTNAGDRPAGWVGQITSNSFMKREFGSKLIETFLKGCDLQLVVDSSGAYIPGHGTPTVILVGRAQRPVGDTVRAVLGIRGEPGRPDDPSNGLVWRSIVDHVDDAGHEDDYTSTAALPRTTLATHPWSIGGGSAGSLISAVEEGAGEKMAARVLPIGYTGQTNADGIFLGEQRSFTIRNLPEERIRLFATGDQVRDFQLKRETYCLLPYDNQGELIPEPTSGDLFRFMWPHRRVLESRTSFAGGTYKETGKPWWSWHQLAKWRLTGEGLTWPLVATHNHFCYIRDAVAHNRHAPVIKLPEGASEDDHLALLGVLNSSTACFEQ